VVKYSRQKRASCRHAYSARAVRIVEDDTLPSQSVEIGCIELAITGVTNLIISMLISHDQDDIGSTFALSRFVHTVKVVGELFNFLHPLHRVQESSPLLVRI
jgi:hypothetical protein